MASDLNSRYLNFWPLAQRAWREIVGLEPRLVLVGCANDVSPELLADPQVQLFQPVDGIHTALQAQCIRLLYPAILDADGAILVSDIDMIPLTASYFRRGVAWASPDDFVAYRDVLLSIHEIPMCYGAALASTWGEIFGVATLDDVRSRLVAWCDGLEYAGVRGQAGWNTDQMILYRTLLKWGAETRRAWILGDDWTGFNRLDRAELAAPRRLNESQRSSLIRGEYSDYHMLAGAPELNEAIIGLACGRADH